MSLRANREGCFSYKLKIFQVIQSKYIYTLKFQRNETGQHFDLIPNFCIQLFDLIFIGKMVGLVARKGGLALGMITGNPHRS